MTPPVGQATSLFFGVAARHERRPLTYLEQRLGPIVRGAIVVAALAIFRR